MGPLKFIGPQVCTRKCARIRVRARTEVCTHTQVCTHKCARASVHLFVCVRTLKCAHTRRCSRKDAHARVFTHSCGYTHRSAHTHTHTSARTEVSAHTWMRSSVLFHGANLVCVFMRFCAANQQHKSRICVYRVQTTNGLSCASARGATRLGARGP